MPKKFYLSHTLIASLLNLSSLGFGNMACQNKDIEDRIELLEQDLYDLLEDEIKNTLDDINKTLNGGKILSEAEWQDLQRKLNNLTSKCDNLGHQIPNNLKTRLTDCEKLMQDYQKKFDQFKTTQEQVNNAQTEAQKKLEETQKKNQNELKKATENTKKALEEPQAALMKEFEEKIKAATSVSPADLGNLAANLKREFLAQLDQAKQAIEHAFQKQLTETATQSKDELGKVEADLKKDFTDAKNKSQDELKNAKKEFTKNLDDAKKQSTTHLEKATTDFQENLTTAQEKLRKEFMEALGKLKLPPPIDVSAGSLKDKMKQLEAAMQEKLGKLQSEYNTYKSEYERLLNHRKNVTNQQQAKDLETKMMTALNGQFQQVLQEEKKKLQNELQADKAAFPKTFEEQAKKMAEHLEKLTERINQVAADKEKLQNGYDQKLEKIKAELEAKLEADKAAFPKTFGEQAQATETGFQNLDERINQFAADKEKLQNGYDQKLKAVKAELEEILGKDKKALQQIDSDLQQSIKDLEKKFNQDLQKKSEELVQNLRKTEKNLEDPLSKEVLKETLNFFDSILEDLKSTFQRVKSVQ